MKINGAILREQPGRWTVEELDLDPPGEGEVLVKMAASGVCRSDLHIARGESSVRSLPICGGHEGAGVVLEVGPGVRGIEVGDHVVTSFIPACGSCTWCAAGLQQLCNAGSMILDGSQLDGTKRLRTADAEPVTVGTTAMLGTFATHQVLDQMSCVPIRKDIPLDRACLLACGVPTGWGSAVHAAKVGPGDVVLILGTGGVGINAVQGAKLAGAREIVVVDPLEFKRQMAEKFGASRVFADFDEAVDFVRSITNGQGAAAVIITIGDIDGSEIGPALDAVAKSGVLVVTSQAGMGHQEVQLDLFQLAMYQKRIQGVLYGTAAPRSAIPALADLYASGQLNLDDLVTTTYSLDQIDDAFADLEAGSNLRGVIVFETEES